MCWLRNAQTQLTSNLFKFQIQQIPWKHIFFVTLSPRQTFDKNKGCRMVQRFWNRPIWNSEVSYYNLKNKRSMLWDKNSFRYLQKLLSLFFFSLRYKINRHSVHVYCLTTVTFLTICWKLCLLKQLQNISTFDFELHKNLLLRCLIFAFVMDHECIIW